MSKFGSLRKLPPVKSKPATIIKAQPIKHPRRSALDAALQHGLQKKKNSSNSTNGHHQPNGNNKKPKQQNKQTPTHQQWVSGSTSTTRH